MPIRSLLQVGIPRKAVLTSQVISVGLVCPSALQDTPNLGVTRCDLRMILTPPPRGYIAEETDCPFGQM